jgi:hypothetical protein
MDTLIEELNLLWEPVRPFLAREIEELYGRRDGHILEIGPFSGLIFVLAQKNIGENFSIAAFPEGALYLFQREALQNGLEDRVWIIESDSSLIDIAEGSVDMAIFRGAFFFPKLFQADLYAVYRILKTGGIAFVGGGFGKYTPPEVIAKIAERSMQLNDAMGRVRVTVESIREQVRASHLEKKCKIITEGGLWVVIKK